MQHWSVKVWGFFSYFLIVTQTIKHFPLLQQRMSSTGDILLCFQRSAAGPLLSSGRNRCRLQSCPLGRYVLNGECTTPHPVNNHMGQNSVSFYNIFHCLTGRFDSTSLQMPVLCEKKTAFIHLKCNSYICSGYACVIMFGKTSHLGWRTLDDQVNFRDV